MRDDKSNEIDSHHSELLSSWRPSDLNFRTTSSERANKRSLTSGSTNDHVLLSFVSSERKSEPRQLENETSTCRGLIVI